MPIGKPRIKPDPMPRGIFVGDRVRIIKQRLHQYRVACELAGYVTNLDAVFEIIREDHFGTGKRRRLFIAPPPYALYPEDVQLAWNSDAERREELKKRGHI